MYFNVRSIALINFDGFVRGQWVVAFLDFVFQLVHVRRLALRSRNCWLLESRFHSLRSFLLFLHGFRLGDSLIIGLKIGKSNYKQKCALRESNLLNTVHTHPYLTLFVNLLYGSRLHEFYQILEEWTKFAVRRIRHILYQLFSFRIHQAFNLRIRVNFHQK